MNKSFAPAVFMLLFGGTAVSGADAPQALPTMQVHGQVQADSQFNSLLEWEAGQDQALSDLLATAPGVQVRAAGGLGAYSEASLRGSSAKQVGVLYDGMPLQVGGGQAINLSLFPISLVSGAEVYRGRTPLAMGQGAAGAINLLPPKKNRHAAHLGYGSFANWRTSLALANADSLLALGRELSDNDFSIRNPHKPFDPNDPQRLAKEPRRHAQVAQNHALLRHRWGRQDVFVYGLAQQQNLPDRVNSLEPRSALDTDLWMGAWRLKLSAGRFSRLQWQQMREHYRDPGSRIGLGEQDAEHRSRRLAWDTQWSAWGQDWYAQSQWEGFRSHDRLSSSQEAPVQRWEQSLATQWSGEQLNAAINLRYQQERQAGHSEDVWLLDPVVGWREAFGNVCRLMANAGHRSRAPGFFERYGDRGYFVGNPALKAEKLLFVDAGAVCAQSNGVRWQSAVFAQEIRDAIVAHYDARGVGRSVNASRASVLGWEAELDWPLSERWTLQSNVTLMHTEDRSNVRSARGQQLPGRTPVQLYSGLSYQRGSWRVQHDFQFEHGAYYDNSNLLPVPTRRQHHLSLQWQWLSQVSLRLQARNLRDEQQAQFNGFPLPGRSYFFSIYTVMN